MLLIAAWFLRSGKVATAGALLVVSLSHVAAFTMAQYHVASPAPALLLPTIIICGLAIGGYFLAGWTTICVGLLFGMSSRAGDLDYPAIILWCGVYVATAYLIWLFSSHLEALLAASRRAEEERREAVIEERTRLAREVHDTLAQGFTGIVVQINAAEQIAGEKTPEVWSHLERARTLARQSLTEARQSILALRSTGSGPTIYSRDCATTARQLLVDDSVQLETKREGEAFPLSGKVHGRTAARGTGGGHKCDSSFAGQ